MKRIMYICTYTYSIHRDLPGTVVEQVQAKTTSRWKKETYGAEHSVERIFPCGDELLAFVSSRSTRYRVPELWKSHTRISLEQKGNWRKFARLLMPNMDDNGPHLAHSSSMNRSGPHNLWMPTIIVLALGNPK